MTDFQKYLIKYCSKHHCTESEAKSHALVQAMEQYYEHVNDGKIPSTTSLEFGCGGVTTGGEAK